MANRLIKRRYNNLLATRNHYYNDGGLFSNPFKGAGAADFKNSLIGAAGAAVGNIGGGAIGGGLESGAGKALQGLSSIASAIPGPWGAVACLCEGQRVITRDGRFVNIEDLTPEDGIIGFSEQTNSIAPQTTTLQMLEFYKPCVRIELQSGLNLECSTDHPVYIADSGRATRKYVDGVRTRVKTYSYVKAGDIKVGQYAGVIDEIPIFGNLNVEKAYLIGMLIGDGSYTKRSIVALHTGDEDTWNYVESNSYGVVVNRFDSEEKYSKEFRTYRIIDGCQMMRGLGLYGQSKFNKTLPNNIHLWNKESIANLIAGLWDTDGYVTIESNDKKKHRICFCQSNFSLIRAVQEQLIKFGIHSSIKFNKPKKSIIKGRQVNSKESYVLTIKDKKSCLRFIENIHLNISYKQKNLDRIKELIKAKFTKDNSFRQGVHADRIVSITPIGVQRIYNLEAHQDHNYIANFIVTHNSAGLGVLGGLTNRMFGSKLNTENIAKVESDINRLNNFQSNASDYDTLSQNWANANAAMGFSDSYIGKDGWFSNTAKKKARELRAQVETGNAFMQNALLNNAANIENSQAQNMLGNYTAFGGKLMTHGATFNTGVIKVNNGGTHEENPYEGVPMGVDEQGIPNLVEEGEVIFDDYVFSNRLKVPKSVRKKYKLRGNKPLTFADAATQMSKESEERPNDPISQLGLKDSLTKLRDAQEQVRVEKAGVSNKFAIGGDTAGSHSRMTPRGYAVTPFVGPDPIYVSGGKSPDSGYISTAPPIVKRVYPEMPTLPPGISPDIQGSTMPKKFALQEPTKPGEESGTSTGGIKRLSQENGNNKLGNAPTWMRYIPAFASGVMSITDALGLTNKPDYGDAEAMLEASRGAGTYTPISFRPVGNYLTYNPFDRDYYLNKLNAEAGATRRSLLNTASGNRGTAMAGLLASDYNALGKVGDLARQAEEYNLAQRQKVEEFNRATDMFNSEGIFKADAANQSAQLNARSSYLKGMLSASELRQKERLAATSARSANLSNFINSLGDIGRENYQRNMIISDPSKYYYIDGNGNVIYKGAYHDLDEAGQTYVDGYIARNQKKTEGNNNGEKKNNKAARGGYLTIKRKRR